MALTLALLLLTIRTPAAAQDSGTNLLRDPGFEFNGEWRQVTYDEASGSRFSVAPDWNGWFATRGTNDPAWRNNIPNGYPHSETGAGFTRSGNRSQEISRGGATFTAAVYQTVAVAQGSNVTASAWARMNLNLNSNPSAQARIGIDPNGGTNPYDSDIVWSTPVINSINSFTQMTVSATATGPSVTLFLFATQQFPSDPNGVYWDDASLTIGGPGGSAGGVAGTPGTAQPGATPLPTQPPAPAFAPPVQPQGAQDDGSIVHTVGSGDTIDSIAAAYSTTRDAILALNPQITNPRFISIGQRILVREAPEGGSSEEDEDDEDEAAASEEDDEGSQPTARPTRTRTPRPTEAADDEESVEAASEDEEEATEEPEMPEPTSTPAPTNTPAPTAPVAVAQVPPQAAVDATVGAVCVMLFEDDNQNARMDQDETTLAGGTITLNQGGSAVGNFQTDDSLDPFCFEDLQPGQYTTVASAPQGYGLTTADQFTVRVTGGATITVQPFGAAQGVEAIAPEQDSVSELEPQAVVLEDETTDEDDNTELLQNLGLIVFGLAGLTLLGGLGTIVLMRRR
jgi:LysM repeat protein